MSEADWVSSASTVLLVVRLPVLQSQDLNRYISLKSPSDDMRR